MGYGAGEVAVKRGIPTWALVLLVAGGLFVGLLFCGGIAAALLLPAVQNAREAGRRAVCQNNLHSIAAAMEMYALEHGTYPPAYEVRNGHKVSWRVLLLPYLEQANLYDQYNFEEPWDGPNNSKLGEVLLEVYRCPSDPPMGDGDHATSYMVISGEGAIFNGTQTVSPNDVSAGDGRTNTILVVEVVGSSVHWMEPRDLVFSEMIPAVNGSLSGDEISSFHPGGANVAFADGRTRLIGEAIDTETLAALITYDGGEVIDAADIP